MTHSDSGLTEREVEVRKNYAVFERLLRETNLLEKHRDEYALMHREKLRGVFTTAQDASQAGVIAFGGDIYSVQEITDVPLELGFYSGVVSLG